MNPSEDTSLGRAVAAPPTERVHPAEPVPVTDPRVLAVLPAQLLQPGEVIVLMLKPSPWYILLESLYVLLALGVVWVLGQTLHNWGLLPFRRADLWIGLMGLGAARLVWQTLDWLARWYVLTDRRVIVMRGVVRVQVFECALKRIQHTTTTFSLRERLFGLGSIHFFTAGTGGAEASWRMIAKPLDVHRTVVQTLNRYR